MKVSPNKIREHVLDMVYNKKSGHIGGSFSLAEIVAYIYNNYYIGSSCLDTNADFLILSKGHAAPIIYAAQIEAGIYSPEYKSTFRDLNSPFQGHPDVRFNPGVFASTGSLGQGLSIACGMALSKKIRNEAGVVFCIIGDGEINEGQCYEALMFANKYKLNNLIIILDNNGYQNDGATSDIMPINSIEEIVKGFGLDTISINGNDYKLLENNPQILQPNGKSKFIIANTVKGYGVSFMQGQHWHSAIPNEVQYRLAKEELQWK